jgi:DNA transformation protein and related proteins
MSDGTPEATVMAGERFEDRVHDRLAALGEVSSRPLFGGRGLYRDGTIFGILFRCKLFLKVDDRSKADYLARGMGPFRPNDRQTLKSYYQVPPDVIADPEALLSWVEGAIRVGQEPQDPGMKK